MALVQVQLSIRLTDLDGVDTPQQTYFDIDDAKTIAELNTAVQAYQQLLDPVTDALIAESTAKVLTGLNVLNKSVPGPNPIEKNGLFTYSKTGQSNRSYGVTTPAWAQAKISGGKINLADSAVQAYYKNWFPNNITNLSSFLSNNWESLQRAYLARVNNRSTRREADSVSEEVVP